VPTWPSKPGMTEHCPLQEPPASPPTPGRLVVLGTPHSTHEECGPMGKIAYHEGPSQAEGSGGMGCVQVVPNLALKIRVSCRTFRTLSNFSTSRR
jgi:hypothetical protein